MDLIRVNKVKIQARSCLEEEVKQGLVIDELYVVSWHSFLLILGQFHLKDVLIEKELQLFIGDVDAQLFEAVVGEILEPVDVQYADPGGGAGGAAPRGRRTMNTGHNVTCSEGVVH